MIRPALPTVSGMIFLFLTAAGIWTAVVNPGLLTALPAAVFSGITLASWILAQFTFDRFRVERVPGGDGTAMEEFSMPVRITNRTPFPRHGILVSETCGFSRTGFAEAEARRIGPHETVTLERKFQAVRRGFFHQEKIRIVTGDPAGLFRKSRVFREKAEILIFPANPHLSNLPLKSVRDIRSAGEGRPLGQAGLGYEFFGVRPFRNGDEMRFIHWKSSARSGELMVKELEATAADRVTVVLDTCAKNTGEDKFDNNFEALTGAANAIVNMLGKIYCHLTFVTVLDGEILSMEGDAAGMLRRIREILLSVGPGKIPPEDLLAGAMEHVPPGSVFFLLAMSDTEFIRKNLTAMEEDGVDVRFLSAPPEAFPVVSPDGAGRGIALPRKKRPKGSVEPLILTRGTDLDILMNGRG